MRAVKMTLSSSADWAALTISFARHNVPTELSAFLAFRRWSMSVSMGISLMSCCSEAAGDKEAPLPCEDIMVALKVDDNDG